MDELTFRVSPLKLTRWAMLAASIISTPYLLRRAFPRTEQIALWMLWICAAIVSLCVFLMIVRSFSCRPAMRLSPEGFEAKCYGIPFVPWTDVENIWTARSWGGSLMWIKLRNPEPFLEKLSTIRRALVQFNRKSGFGEVCLATGYLEPDFSELMGYVRKHIPDVRG
jgi:hypothetical protein